MFTIFYDTLIESYRKIYVFQEFDGKEISQQNVSYQHKTWNFSIKHRMQRDSTVLGTGN